MDLDAYRSHDALGLAELVRSGGATPHELLDAALACVEAANPSVNAVVAVFEDEARQAIDAGLPDGPFTGVPFVLKDLWTRVAGAATSNGNVTHNGNPSGGCSLQATSSPPFETFRVSHTSDCWPSGATHRSLTGRRRRTRACWRCCKSAISDGRAPGYAGLYTPAIKPDTKTARTSY